MVVMLNHVLRLFLGKVIWQFIWQFILLLIFSSLFFYSRPMRAGDCAVSTGARSTFRFPIVLKGPKWLQGKRISHMEVWAFQKGLWRQVDYQFDEINVDGDYVLEEGQPYTSKTGTGIFNMLDEFSILGSSLGDFFDLKSLPSIVKDRFGERARVDYCDAKKKYLGSVLVGVTRFFSPPPKFTPLFQRDQKLVVSKIYQYQFRSDQPMLMGDVKLQSPSGLKSVFSGSSFLMPLVSPLFFLPSLYFGADDFTSEIESWRSGPVRSIVAVGSKLKKFFNLIDLHLFSELVFYEDYFQIPTHIEFVFDPYRYLGRGSGLAYILNYADKLPWVLQSNLGAIPPHGPQELIKGHSALDAAADGRFKVLGHSDLGSFLAQVRVDPRALRQAPPPYLLANDDFHSSKIRDAWPWVGKVQGSLGVFIDISDVKGGIYDFALDVALSNQAHDEFADFQSVSASWQY